ncbi:MAG: hypothetical protein C0623_11410 [Desulfuromonas sp.]|nr:MAG: hypothetical protein C0623_11410 [Desulfuromonas sp.]
MFFGNEGSLYLIRDTTVKGFFHQMQFILNYKLSRHQTPDSARKNLASITQRQLNMFLFRWDRGNRTKRAKGIKPPR